MPPEKKRGAQARADSQLMGGQRFAATASTLLADAVLSDGRPVRDGVGDSRTLALPGRTTTVRGTLRS